MLPYNTSMPLRGTGLTEQILFPIEYFDSKYRRQVTRDLLPILTFIRSSRRPSHCLCRNRVPLDRARHPPSLDGAQ